MTAHAPIFVVGVPRSGTTLVRLILDAHPAIACGPESPWLCAHHDRTIQRTFDYIVEDEQGLCKSFGVERDEVVAATRAYVDTLFKAYARKHGKARWAEKTPGSAPYLAFIRALFPDALFIHVTRNGMDVAASTAIVDEQRAAISPEHTAKLDLGHGLVTDNTPFAAAVRHRYWNASIARSLAGAAVFHVAYESLVTDPEAMAAKLCAFIGEPFDPAMLAYDQSPHELPAWEWGTADAAKHSGITPNRIGVGEQAIGPCEASLIRPIVDSISPPISQTNQLPQPSSSSPPPSSLCRSVAPSLPHSPAPIARLASLGEMGSESYCLFMNRTNALARSLGLREMTNWSKIWEYPFLWFAALSKLDLSRTRLIDIGSETSVMPWLCALLGADVTMIETNRSLEPLWSGLRSKLDVSIDWRFVDDASIPVADASVDCVTSFSVIEHQPDRSHALNELGRVLKPGGVLAMSFDVVEAGMTFPESNGRAMSLAEFERDVWLHEAFTGNGPITQSGGEMGWNIEDVAPFHAWHKTTAPHHDYVVAAAVLQKVRHTATAPKA